jgi:hypothetical protein
MFRLTGALFGVGLVLATAGCSGPSNAELTKKLNEISNRRLARDFGFHVAFEDARKAVVKKDVDGLVKATGKLKELGGPATSRIIEIAKSPSSPKQDRVVAVIVLGAMSQRTDPVLDALREVAEKEEDAELKKKASEALAHLTGKS